MRIPKVTDFERYTYAISEYARLLTKTTRNVHHATILTRIGHCTHMIREYGDIINKERY